jgi:hypothetical protein
MKKRDDLFKLIKSLTRNEKGYFKKFSKINSSETSSSYMILFDAVDRMKVYNEATLKKAMEGHIQITALSTLKNYLYDLILRSLRNYYENTDSVIKALNQKADLYILGKKGLVEAKTEIAAPPAKKEEKAKKPNNKTTEFEPVSIIMDRLVFFTQKLKNAGPKDSVKVAYEIELTLKKQPYLKQELKTHPEAKAPYYELMIAVYSILGKHKKKEKAEDKLRKLTIDKESGI